jgi:uncharacterized protein (TIGR03437 family)
MLSIRWIPVILLSLSALHGATFGTVVNVTGGASDIVLDEPRGRIYLVRPSPYNYIDIYSTTQRRTINSIRTDAQPLAAALSRDGKILWVTCYDASSIVAIDLDTQALVKRVSLPAKPEGIAIGADGRILFTTIGTGAGNLLNTLMVFDPAATDTSKQLSVVAVAPPPPQSPILPPVAGRVFLAMRSQLIATRDGKRIIGINAYANTNRALFVYEVVSATVTKSRLIVGDQSTVLSISPDGSKFMAGLRLFDTDTLTVLAQMNAANAPFPLTATTTAQGFTQVATQFNTQQNQGGSIFAPSGANVYAAFNVAPIQSPPARANIAQMMISDPDNLLITLGIQLAENLAGKMVVTSDGATIYGLSESGFMTLPISTLQDNPILLPSSTVLLLGNDQCGVIDAARRGTITINNAQRNSAGRPIIATPTLLSSLSATNVPALGGVGGAGGGFPGGGVVINLPGVPGAGLPGILQPGQTQQQAQITTLSPSAQVVRDNATGATGFQFSFSSLAARSIGTAAPTDFVVTSDQAVNIPPSIRVFQNNRDSESRGTIVPIPVGLSPNEGLLDLVYDSSRQRLYISNSGLNRVEVFDIRTGRLQTPIKVGQLPHALALTPDNNTLYVANTGGESISVVDLDQAKVIDRIRFPALPFNGSAAIVNPSVIAYSQRGLQIVMSNGTLWKVIGKDALPRAVSPIIGSSTIPAPRNMASTPNGEFVLLLDGNGYANLYDSLVDDYVQRRQVQPAPIQGYYGPVSAGPRGQYFLVNGWVLNQSLSPIATAGTTQVSQGNGGFGSTPGRGGTTTQTLARPVPAVFASGTNTFARLTTPVVANNTQVNTAAPQLEIVDVSTGFATSSASALEGPVSTVVGTQRANVAGRTMAVDSTASNAYVLTTSGLSVIPLDVIPASARPVVPQNSVVSTASFLPKLAQGSLASIFGRNLASSAAANPTGNLPTFIGGVCVTLNSLPMPLIMTSTGQINVEVPPELNAGTYPLIVRSVDRKAASTQVSLTVVKYAPAVFVDPAGQASIFHMDGSPVTKDNPASRDEQIQIRATGLGLPPGTTKLVSGIAPTKPLATAAVKVYFGDPRYKEAEMIVNSSTVVPGSVGQYLILVTVPGAHLRGNTLPVTIQAGGVNSPSTGPALPVIAVQ